MSAASRWSGYSAAVRGYSFPEILPMEASLKRAAYLASALGVEDVPVLRAELHARLTEMGPTLAQALRARNPGAVR